MPYKGHALPTEPFYDQRVVWFLCDSCTLRFTFAVRTNVIQCHFTGNTERTQRSPSGRHYGCPRCFFPCQPPLPRHEICSSDGGLFVAFVNAPYLNYKTCLAGALIPVSYVYLRLFFYLCLSFLSLFIT